MLIHFICRVRAGINPGPTAKPINTDAGVDFLGGSCVLYLIDENFTKSCCHELVN